MTSRIAIGVVLTIGAQSGNSALFPLLTRGAV